jgi:glycosyltransferase involved in cell wall biosynthesis
MNGKHRPLVVHLTSAHLAFDGRIFIRECRTLVSAGYEVILIAPNDRDETVEGVRIKAVPKPNGRMVRLTRTIWQVFRAAVRQPAIIYHFHDPELFIAAAFLKLINGGSVIFDCHEDYPLVALRRSWIPRLLRHIVSAAVRLLFRLLLPLFNGVVAATDSIAMSLSHPQTAVVKNYADLPLGPEDAPHESNLLVYAGSISHERGIRLFVDAFARMNHVMPVRLRLIGTGLYSDSLEKEIRNFPPGSVEVLPWMKHADALKLMASGTLGLGLDLPLPGIDGPPTKYFEYMALGLPIVSADLPVMRQIVEDAGCGIAVDFRQPSVVADKVLELLKNPQILHRMRRNGRRAFAENYHWRTQVPALLSLYEHLAQSSVKRSRLALRLPQWLGRLRLRGWLSKEVEGRPTPTHDAR